MHKTLIFISLWLFLLGTGYAQDTILRMTGREIPCKYIQADLSSCSFYKMSGVKKSKMKNFSYVNDTLLVSSKGDTIIGHTLRKDEEKIEYRRRKKATIQRRELFFSVYGSVGEKTLYQQDTMARGFELTEDEMRAYVYGKRSARRYYTNGWAFAGGAVSGLAGTPFNYIFAPLPTLAFSAVYFSIRPKVKKTGPEDIPYLQNPYFIEGYRNQANMIKMRNTLITAVPGIGAAIVLKAYVIPK